MTLHNLIHMPEDIVRFSAPDNVWCYVFERAVRGYVERSSNKKNLESTFAKAECRREFLKFTFPSTDALHPVPPPLPTALVSLDTDMALLCVCIFILGLMVHSYFVSQLHAPLAQAQQLITAGAKDDGILVGGKHYFALLHTDAQQVLDLLGTLALDVSISTTNIAAVFVRSVYMPSHGYNGTLYRVGEHCLLQDEQANQIIVRLKSP